MSNESASSSATRLLPSITGVDFAQSDLERVELVLFKCGIFFRHSVSSSCSKHEQISLENLSTVRAMPFDYLRNLHLCDSVDSAETEILRIKPFNPYKVLVVNSEFNVLFEHEVLQLADRLKDHFIFVQSALTYSSDVGLLGNYYLNDFGEEALAEVRDLAMIARKTGVCLMVTLHPDILRPAEIVAFFHKANVYEKQLVLAGAFYRPGVAQELLGLSRATLVVEPHGPGVECVRIDQSEWPIMDDETIAGETSNLMHAFPDRLVLGAGIIFATQLRRYGGSGFEIVPNFIKRLKRFGCTEDSLKMLMVSNGLNLLATKAPPAPLAPASVMYWDCAACNKKMAEGSDFFESHGKRFCSSKCMRKFRTDLEEEESKRRSGDGNNQGGGRVRVLGPEGVWGLQV